MSQSTMRHIAHPTGRIIGRRDGYKPNIEQLMVLAEETSTVLEINANPHRLRFGTPDIVRNIQM